MTERPMNPRLAAARALMQIGGEQGYSNIVLDQLLKTTALVPADAALATRLVYGVTERRLTLDYLIAACSSVPLRRMHPAVAESLRLGAYQLLYMEKIPAAAAVSESVNLVKRMKQGHAAGFVNGVLRGIQRRRHELLDALGEDDRGLSLRHSCPEELIRFWREGYGGEVLAGLLASLNEPPPVCLRINTLQTTDAAFTAAAEKAGATCIPVEGLPHCVRISAASALKKLAKSCKSWYYHQDAASQWCCRVLAPAPDERVADVCAAPGGKSLTVAQMMENRGELLAGDLYPAKCGVMAERAADCGVSILQTVCRDASSDCPPDWIGRFDRVLCDVPCSGLGVIRRKPEIRYKPLESFRELPELQLRILEQSARLVRPGGVLQYSTCTLNPAENQEVARRFLERHPDFSPRPLPLDGCANALDEPNWYRTFLPHIHQTDGFFVAGFLKEVDD